MTPLIKTLGTGIGRDLLAFIFSNTDTFSVYTLQSKFSKEKYPVSLASVRRYVSRFLSTPGVKKYVSVESRKTREGVRESFFFKSIVKHSECSIDCLYHEVVLNKGRSKSKNIDLDQSRYKSLVNDLKALILNQEVGMCLSESKINDIYYEKNHKSLAPIIIKNALNILRSDDVFAKALTWVSLNDEYVYTLVPSTNQNNTTQIEDSTMSTHTLESMITRNNNISDFTTTKGYVFLTLLSLPVNKALDFNYICHACGSQYPVMQGYSMPYIKQLISRIVTMKANEPLFTFNKSKGYTVVYTGYKVDEAKSLIDKYKEDKQQDDTLIVKHDTITEESVSDINIDSVLDNLMDAVQLAGGRCADFTRDKLNNMSALEFIKACHLNMNIKFSKKEK